MHLDVLNLERTGLTQRLEAPPRHSAGPDPVQELRLAHLQVDASLPALVDGLVLRALRGGRGRALAATEGKGAVRNVVHVIGRHAAEKVLNGTRIAL